MFTSCVPNLWKATKKIPRFYIGPQLKIFHVLQSKQSLPDNMVMTDNA